MNVHLDRSHQDICRRMERLKHDREYLLEKGHILENPKLGKRACDWPTGGKYSETGCFDDCRLKCEMMYRNIGGRTLDEYLGEFKDGR